jgi:hypothetical protein
METKQKRGSEKLLAAWKARALSEESVKEIASALEKSSAQLEAASFVGGSAATGVTVSLSYSGDDVPQCGNDIQFWLAWLRKHGGTPRPPRVIINGIPFPDLIKLELDFGHPGGPVQGGLELGGLAGAGAIGR